MSNSLWDGPYGAMEQIRSRTRYVYRQIGFPEAVSDLAVHPLLDHFVWERLSSGTTQAPTAELLVPVSGDPSSPERWCRRDHPADAALADHLTNEVRLQFEIEEEPVTPDGAFAERISRAHRLLSETIPEIWENTAPFVTRVYDVPSESASSASLDHTGGAIFLSSAAAVTEPSDDIVELAECLLHEAAHSKSYRIFRGFTTMSVPDSPDFIDVPWWRVGGQTWEWDVDRSIVASHVYSHLATFYDRLAETRPEVSRRRQQAAFRAQFLANVLSQLPPEFVDDEWRDFISWTAHTIVPIGTLSEAGSRELSRPLSSFPHYRAPARAQ